MKRQTLLVASVLVVLCATGVCADATKLYGIHWWGFSGSLPVDGQPALLLDAVSESAWDLETVVTDSGDSWWEASYFAPLYQELVTNKNMTIITRVDYNWGETVPHTGVSAWADKVVSEVVNVLKDYCHLWVIGNEPNVTVEGNNFPDNKIPPAYFVDVYKTVRERIHSTAQSSPLGDHLVLLGPVSPGGVAGVRWMSGSDYLASMLQLLDPAEVDGFAIHAYGWNVTDFHTGYVNQLSLIDGYGCYDKPVYLTEWNRATDTGNPNDEANTAQFIRDAFADVNSWNAGSGHHNVICMTWFVYDSDNQAGGLWNSYAIEYWKDNGYPYGDARDIYTAFEQTVDLRYPAGAVGGGTPPAGELPYKDEFPGSTLGVWWNVDNPDDPSVGTEDSVTVSDGFLRLYSNGYDDDLWTARNACPFVYLESPEGDWTAEVWLQTESGEIPMDHKAGFFITNDLASTANSIIVTMQKSSSWDTGILGSHFQNATHGWIGFESGATLLSNGLRIAREGNSYSVYYRSAPLGTWILLPAAGLYNPQNPVTHPNLGGSVYVGVVLGAWPNANGVEAAVKFDYFGASWNFMGVSEVANWLLYY